MKHNAEPTQRRNPTETVKLQGLIKSVSEKIGLLEKEYSEDPKNFSLSIELNSLRSHLSDLQTQLYNEKRKGGE